MTILPPGRGYRACLSVTFVLAALVVAGCAPADPGDTPADASTGGAPGTGGATIPGSGGAGTGGAAVGTGGAGTGGAATGGAGTGGAGTGGAVATGGQPGSGGRGTGGQPGTGGAGSGGRGVGGSAGSGSGGASSGGAGGTSTGSGGAGGSSGGYNPCPTNGDPCRILPVGDSITVGLNSLGSYRIELFHKALMAMQKITYTGTLQNGPAMVDGVTFPKRFEATSGITIAGISSQITNSNTLMMPADIILVHIGTNDMYMTPAGADTRLGMLLDKLATGLPNALIVVAKIIPLSGSDAQVKAFNASIPPIVQTRVAAGKHIIMVDMFTGFPANGMDGVHPFASGYAWMAGVWYEAIKNLLPK